ncbi:MAG: DEAD/DEAH box helicase [Chlamydiota bacterium]|nr:DEAD/DEAH box helicase [Chlamydiota bacterium]
MEWWRGEWGDALARGGDAVIEGLGEGALASLVATLAGGGDDHIVIITDQMEEPQLLLNLTSCLGKAPASFPEGALLHEWGERLALLDELGRGGERQVIISSLEAAVDTLPSPQQVTASRALWRRGLSIQGDILQRLQADGHVETREVRARGEFAQRPQVIDYFPIASPWPCRLTFSQGELIDIHHYDPATQRPLSPAEEALSFPVERLKGKATLFDHLGEEALLLFFDHHQIHRLIHQRQKEGHILWRPLGEIPARRRFFCSREGESPSSFLPLEGIWQGAPHSKRWQKLIDHTPGQEIALILPTEADERYWRQQVEAADSDHRFSYHRGYLSSGWRGRGGKICLPISELTGLYRLPRSTWGEGIPPAPNTEWERGTPLVHLDHGIGRYRGLVEREMHGERRSFVQIAYAEGGMLYVPFEEADLIAPYEGEDPPLHTLGNPRWRKARQRAEKAIEGEAKKILQMEAIRRSVGGYAYPPDGPEMALFADAFPFSLTPDQELAIQEILADMEKEEAMDRLLCGDVGYGKTEVAMRAAFKAVIGGRKQVALLVPTTLLVSQHARTLTQRMLPFSIRIAALSRFTKAEEAQRIIEQVASGDIDILIGTHRILNEEISFANLGLLIIDEEHRFGVRAKESLKEKKVGVDTLHLSATPIPRTLQASLFGIRSLSRLNTPPKERLPVKTLMAAHSESLIQQALERELARGGQSYVVHHRIASIHQVAEHISSQIPQARVEVAHGQMNPEHVDAIFSAFYRGEVDILVATTVIESGIDVPNANTLIVHHSEQYGLAELYQLRGRVGRWHRLAYAYFLFPKEQESENRATMRLETICNLKSGEGGLSVARQDLSMRGAGDWLGFKQSGKGPAIGLHFYCYLLKEAIRQIGQEGEWKIKGRSSRIPPDCSASFPCHYIPDPQSRLDWYGKLFATHSLTELSAVIGRMEAMIGPLPREGEWLYLDHILRILSLEKRPHSLSIQGKSLTITTPNNEIISIRHQESPQKVISILSP